MLHVDEQPVVVGRRREHAGRAGAQVMHAEAERELVLLQLLFGLVLEHSILPKGPLFGAREGGGQAAYQPTIGSSRR